MPNKDEFKGFPLFNEIDDLALRTRNRAVILANVMEDNTNKAKKVSSRGAGIILGYFLNIPDNERKAVRAAFLEQITQRGFVRV